jgi:hypothetical protein
MDRRGRNLPCELREDSEAVTGWRRKPVSLTCRFYRATPVVGPINRTRKELPFNGTRVLTARRWYLCSFWRRCSMD